jgi:hypothetical protein
MVVTSEAVEGSNPMRDRTLPPFRPPRWASAYIALTALATVLLTSYMVYRGFHVGALQYATAMSATTFGLFYAVQFFYPHFPSASLMSWSGSLIGCITLFEAFAYRDSLSTVSGGFFLVVAVGLLLIAGSFGVAVIDHVRTYKKGMAASSPDAEHVEPVV